MNTIEQSYLGTLAAMDLHSKQRDAVAKHLIEYGELYKKAATQGHVKGAGIIEHPAARIFDLREEGWKIDTFTRPTRWVLVAAPNSQMTIGI